MNTRQLCVAAVYFCLRPPWFPPPASFDVSGGRIAKLEDKSKDIMQNSMEDMSTKDIPTQSSDMEDKVMDMEDEVKDKVKDMMDKAKTMDEMLKKGKLMMDQMNAMSDRVTAMMDKLRISSATAGITEDMLVKETSRTVARMSIVMKYLEKMQEILESFTTLMDITEAILTKNN